MKINLKLTDTGEASKNRREYLEYCIFDSALSHSRRSDASEKREENSVSTFQRFRLWTSFQSSPVSVKTGLTFEPRPVITFDFNVEADDEIVKEISTVRHGTFSHMFQPFAHLIESVSS